MAQLIVVVIHNPNNVDAVVRKWVDLGVTGMTIIDSSGWTSEVGSRELRDDLPLLPSLRTILRSTEERSRTLFSVLPEEFPVDDLVQATEAIIGPLDEPETGILFVLPVSRVFGLQPPHEDGA